MPPTLSEAWWELGCLLQDGEVDGRGAVLVAPDHRGAFLAFRRGARAGDDGALLNLGVCYDNATGRRRDRVKALRCYLRLWRRTQQCAAANNLATWHRDGGNQRRAFSWYQKAADAGDGDAPVALAYAYYYRLGTTKSLARARSAPCTGPDTADLVADEWGRALATPCAAAAGRGPIRRWPRRSRYRRTVASRRRRRGVSRRRPLSTGSSAEL